MKIKKLLKIFGLLILIGNIVNAEYIRRNGEIYYRDWSEEKTRILKNIDKKSFKILENDFAKDKNKVYCKYKEIKDADVQSFSVVSGDEGVVVKDKNRTYENDCE